MKQASVVKNADETILIEHLPYELDDGIGKRASIGLIVLATDYTIEHEWQRVFQNLKGVALYHSRIRNEDIVSPESLRAMESRITSTTELFTPGNPVDVVAYGCTSASMAIGEEKVFKHIHAAKPDAKCTTPITAAFAAFKVFNAQRIAVLTPYPEPVNQIVIDYMAAREFSVPVFGSFNEDRDSRVCRISPQSIENGVREIIKHADVDCVFVSCTSVRLMASCRELEAALGMPVTSSNHAMAWHAMRLAGIEDKLPQFGSLYEHPLTP